MQFPNHVHLHLFQFIGHRVLLTNEQTELRAANTLISFHYFASIPLPCCQLLLGKTQGLGN